MIKNEQIKEELAQAIRDSGMSQNWIVEKLGLRQQTISEYINDKTMTSLETFANLCDVLDLDANEILCISKGKFN